MTLARFREVTLDAMTIDDAESFRHVGLYADLEEILRRDRYSFRILPRSASKAKTPRWDRALLLNLTFWGARGGDVMVDEHIAADVVAHAAWHHLASRALSPSAKSAPSADALFLGEAIASAFDVYLVGRLLGHAPRSSFLATQVPAMADAASAAGLSADGFDALLAAIARDPDRAFEDLRALLFDASTTLVRCRGADDALDALAGFDRHPFAPLLHHYELSSWVLYARAYASTTTKDPRVRAVDRALRKAPVAIDWLANEWVSPDEGAGSSRSARDPAERNGAPSATRRRRARR